MPTPAADMFGPLTLDKVMAKRRADRGLFYSLKKAESRKDDKDNMSNDTS